MLIKTLVGSSKKKYDFSLNQQCLHSALRKWTSDILLTSDHRKRTPDCWLFHWLPVLSLTTHYMDTPLSIHLFFTNQKGEPLRQLFGGHFFQRTLLLRPSKITNKILCLPIERQTGDRIPEKNLVIKLT